jgi:predicted transcriptional regulator
MNRTQIYLDGRQTTRLDERAAAEGTSRSVIIRRAVDVYLEQEERVAAAWQDQWKHAIEGSAGLAPGFEDGARYVEDVRRADAERVEQLER